MERPDKIDLSVALAAVEFILNDLTSSSSKLNRTLKPLTRNWSDSINTEFITAATEHE